MTAAQIRRCAWCLSDPLLVEYHDAEWGTPSRDDHYLFEILSLEGAQAGLSWLTVLRKREGYRRLFAGFDPERVARFDRRHRERILKDAAVIRHAGKIDSVVSNAGAVLGVAREHGSFANYVWTFVDGKPLQNRRRRAGDLPAETEVSRALSRDLLRRGFRFVGPTTCYAFMQAVGMVNDHEVGCFRRRLVRPAR
jgi:DNA-3-methyladenine glycosylase I